MTVKNRTTSLQGACAQRPFTHARTHMLVGARPRHACRRTRAGSSNSRTRQVPPSPASAACSDRAAGADSPAHQPTRFPVLALQCPLAHTWRRMRRLLLPAELHPCAISSTQHLRRARVTQQWRGAAIRCPHHAAVPFRGLPCLSPLPILPCAHYLLDSCIMPLLASPSSLCICSLDTHAHTCQPAWDCFPAACSHLGGLPRVATNTTWPHSATQLPSSILAV